jgi:hypothetical protein
MLKLSATCTFYRRKSSLVSIYQMLSISVHKFIHLKFACNNCLFQRCFAFKFSKEFWSLGLNTRQFYQKIYNLFDLIRVFSSTTKFQIDLITYYDESSFCIYTVLWPTLSLEYFLSFSNAW